MDANQLPPRKPYAPDRVICDGSTNARTDAHDYRPDVTRVIVIPGRREVVAFIGESLTTFECASILMLSDVLIGLGIFKGTSDVPMKYTNQDAPAHEQYIIEKPLMGKETFIERAIRV